MVLQAEKPLVLLVCGELDGSVGADAGDSGRITPPKEGEALSAHRGHQEPPKIAEVVRRVRDCLHRNCIQ